MNNIEMRSENHIQEIGLGSIASELDNAMQSGELFLVYQPQLDSSTGRLVGFESLIRWRHPIRGFVPPDIFIPLAEQSGKIVELGAWILDRACADLRKFHSAKRSDALQVAVNLSSVQLATRTMPGKIMEVLDKHSLLPKHLHLELTETALITNFHEAISNVRALTNAGVEVWIDDFGTGFTSIMMLREFPVSGIKIDRSFIKNICDDTDDSDFCLVSALIAMAQRMRLKVVAEGVETEEQLRVLQQLGCDRLQGYLIGKPVTLSKIFSNWR